MYRREELIEIASLLPPFTSLLLNIAEYLLARGVENLQKVVETKIKGAEKVDEGFGVFRYDHHVVLHIIRSEALR